MQSSSTMLDRCAAEYLVDGFTSARCELPQAHRNAHRIRYQDIKITWLEPR